MPANGLQICAVRFETLPVLYAANGIVKILDFLFPRLFAWREFAVSGSLFSLD